MTNHILVENILQPSFWHKLVLLLCCIANLVFKYCFRIKESMFNVLLRFMFSQPPTPTHSIFHPLLSLLSIKMCTGVSQRRSWPVTSECESQDFHVSHLLPCLVMIMTMSATKEISSRACKK